MPKEPECYDVSSESLQATKTSPRSTSAAKPRRRSGSLGRRYVPQLIYSPRLVITAFVIALVLFLELITRANLVSPVVIPPPDQVLHSLIAIFKSGALFTNLFRTVFEVVISVFCAIVGGVGSALALWRLPLLKRILEPYLVGLYAMPLILFYPFVLAIFGLGSAPIILIAAIMGMVPVILNSVSAFEQIPEIYFRVAAVLDCSRLTRFFRIALPAAAPLVFAGFKLCLIYSFIGVIVMEFMTGNIGLGYQIANDYNSFKISEMYAYVVVIVALAALIINLFRYGEKALRREG